MGVILNEFKILCCMDRARYYAIAIGVARKCGIVMLGWEGKQSSIKYTSRLAFESWDPVAMMAQKNANMS